MLASLVSSAKPNSPFTPPVTARLMWHATPFTFGSSKPSTSILSLGPTQRKRVLTCPVVPRSGRLHSHTANPSTSRQADTIVPNFLIAAGPARSAAHPVPDRRAAQIGAHNAARARPAHTRP